MIEPGENGDDPELGSFGDPSGVECPADTQVLDCVPSTERFSAEVALLPPVGRQPNSTVMLVGYRSNLLDLGDRDRDAVKDIGPNRFLLTRTDADFAVRLVWTGQAPLTDVDGSSLVLLTFSLCEGAAAPALTDLACQVEGCAGLGGGIEGCNCEIRPAQSDD